MRVPPFAAWGETAAGGAPPRSHELWWYTNSATAEGTHRQTPMERLNSIRKRLRRHGGALCCAVLSGADEARRQRSVPGVLAAALMARAFANV